ncbi:hypothetical protein WCE55_04860 [Luteimonas sp. MJ293]|uniref:hypothetical protein n=1 Tax=Luteimonas sp. MJ146 TaxID=3129240 RepID=UPI0031B9F5F6
MTKIVFRDADEVLLDRVERIAKRHGWDLSRALTHVLERGLHTCEGSDSAFEGGEAAALQAALDALSSIPDDPGFAMIGRVARGHRH